MKMNTCPCWRSAALAATAFVPPLVALLVGLLAPLAATAALVALTPGGTANSFGASVSDDGQRVVFYSASDLTGANADRNFEVFLYDRPSAMLRQITNDPLGTSAGSQNAQISGDGSRIVYQHFKQGPSNTTLFQTLAYDIQGASFSTLTTPGNFQMSDINRDGTKISVNVDNIGLRIFDTTTGFGAVQAAGAFSLTLSGSGNLVSFATLSGGLAVRDVTTGTTTTILPSNTSQNLRPAISQDGQRVAFTASGNLLGQNADGNAELYVYDMASNSLRQLTHTTGGNARGASISGDGSRIAFSTFSDPLGQNGDGNEEIFYYDMNDGLLTQATQTSGAQLFNIEAALSADGRTLAYTSNSRAAGGNGSSQIFLQDLQAPAQSVPEPPTLLLVASMLALAGWRRKRAASGPLRREAPP